MIKDLITEEILKRTILAQVEKIKAHFLMIITSQKYHLG
jgi:hypothetical protein